MAFRELRVDANSPLAERHGGNPVRHGFCAIQAISIGFNRCGGLACLLRHGADHRFPGHFGRCTDGS
ncbi:MAG TPA: hypothetical protein VJ783_21400, partial [Pirellulales bacterium]|nr:hypothetical protein [Pirellulales bacterium]